MLAAVVLIREGGPGGVRRVGAGLRGPIFEEFEGPGVPGRGPGGHVSTCVHKLSRDLHAIGATHPTHRLISAQVSTKRPEPAAVLLFAQVYARC